MGSLYSLRMNVDDFVIEMDFLKPMGYEIPRQFNPKRFYQSKMNMAILIESMYVSIGRYFHTDIILCD